MIWPKMMGQKHFCNESSQGKKKLHFGTQTLTYDFSKTNTMTCSLEKDLKDCH